MELKEKVNNSLRDGRRKHVGRGGRGGEGGK